MGGGTGRALAETLFYEIETRALLAGPQAGACAVHFLALPSRTVTAIQMAQSLPKDDFISAILALVPFADCVEAITNVLVPGQMDALKQCLTEGTAEAQECRRFLGERLNELAGYLAP